MKKIIFALLLFLNVQTVYAISPVVDYDKGAGIYSNRIGDTLHSGKMALITMNGKAVYCLDPFEFVGRTYYEDPAYLASMNKDDVEFFELVSYYGYNYIGRRKFSYYMAAQELIWERIMGGDKVYWTTEENGMGSRIDIEKEKKEILDDINKFYKLPSFVNETITLDYRQNYLLYDGIGTINFYEAIPQGRSMVSSISGAYSILMLDTEKTQVDIVRTLKTAEKTTIYTGVGNQTLGSFGVDKKITGKFYLDYSGRYKTNIKLDFNYNDVDFKLCDEINREMFYEKNDDKYIFRDLPNGKYHICELEDRFILNDDLNFDNDDPKLYELNIHFDLEEKHDEIISDIPKEEPIDKEEVIEEKKEEPILEEQKVEEINNEELPNTYGMDIFKFGLIILVIGYVLYKKM